MNAMPSPHANTVTDEMVNRKVPGESPLNAFRRLLDEIWGENEAPLTRLASGLGLPRDQAADVLHDVYLMAIHKPPLIEDGAELRRWLFRVMANRCHLEHRRRSRWRRLWSSLSLAWTANYVSSRSLVYGELKQEINRALATLSEVDRKLVVMRYFSDLNSREIADIVGMPETTVRGHLRAARRKLADELGDLNDG
jgi:RNA polymerase sigma-70 factor (ECF subfamily)